jgi:hypothetical protein
MMARRKFGRAALLVGALAASLSDSLSQAQPSRCGVWDVEYVLAARMSLSETPFGQGDGVYDVGPGRLVVRFEDRPGSLGKRATVRGFTLRQHLRLESRLLLWTTTLTTDAESRAVSDACGVAGEGELVGSTLRWSRPVPECRTDGTMTCTGPGCGRFGVPPPGRSELHLRSAPLELQPLVFSADGKTFTMAYVPAARSEVPKQASRIALAGRESSRACVPATPCP